FSCGNADKCGNVAVPRQPRMSLHSGFMCAELGPGKPGKTQIDGSRVQRAHALLEIHAHRLRRIPGAPCTDQPLSEVGADAPDMFVIGVGQRGARYPTVKPQVIQLAAQRTETSFSWREGPPSKSVERTPAPDTDPSTKSRVVAHRHRIAPRNGEIRDP